MPQGSAALCFAPPAPGHVRASRPAQAAAEGLRRHRRPVEHRRHLLPRCHRQPALRPLRGTPQEQGDHVGTRGLGAAPWGGGTVAGGCRTSWRQLSACLQHPLTAGWLDPIKPREPGNVARGWPRALCGAGSIHSMVGGCVRLSCLPSKCYSGAKQLKKLGVMFV